MVRRRILALWSKGWIALRPRYKAGAIRVSAKIDDGSIRGPFFWSPDWKSELIGRVLAVRPGAFVDVGANVGQTLMDYLHAGPRPGYVGFEPNAACVVQLADIIQQNGLTDCRIIPAGLSDRSSVRMLHIFGGDSDSGATMESGLRPAEASRTIAVPTYRLDEIAEVVEGPVALVKIDVEGHELPVLQGMAATIRDKRPWVLCEVLHRDRAAEHGSYSARMAALMGFIRDNLDYEAQLIVRSGGHIARFEPVTEFPDRVYDASSKTSCDYMLVPKGEGAQLPS